MANRRSRPTDPVLTREELLVEELFQATRAFRHRLRPLLEREGLTSPMFWALTQLVADGPQNVGALAGACAVTPANVSSAADQLEAAGLVVRTQSTRDRRVVVLSATARGRALHRTVWRALASVLVDALGGVPPDDLRATVRVLRCLSSGPGGPPARVVEVAA